MQTGGAPPAEVVHDDIGSCELDDDVGRRLGRLTDDGHAADLAACGIDRGRQHQVIGCGHGLAHEPPHATRSSGDGDPDHAT